MKYIKLAILAKAMLGFLVLASAQRQEPPKDGTYCTPKTGCMCMNQKDSIEFCTSTGERTAENMMCSKYCRMSECKCCPVE